MPIAAGRAKSLDHDDSRNQDQFMSIQERRANAKASVVQGHIADPPAKSSSKPTEPIRVAPKFPDRVTMTREELYQHVWITPVNLLSAALGLSDVGLAKTCKQMNVPRRGRGYRARLDARGKCEKNSSATVTRSDAGMCLRRSRK